MREQGFQGETQSDIDADSDQDDADRRKTLLPDPPAEPLTADPADLFTKGKEIVDRAVSHHRGRSMGLLGEHEIRAHAYRGVMRAARCWDPARGAAFGTYADALVDGAIRTAIRAELRQRRRHVPAGDMTAGASDPETSSSAPPEAPRVLAGVVANVAGARADLVRSKDDVVVAREALILRRAAVRAAVDELSESKRSLVLLHYFEGLPLRTVARVLAKSYATIKRAHQAIKARLARRLAPLRESATSITDAPTSS